MFSGFWRAKLTVRKLDVEKEEGEFSLTIVFFSSLDVLSILGEVLSYWLEMSDSCSPLRWIPINISKFILFFYDVLFSDLKY